MCLHVFIYIYRSIYLWYDSWSITISFKCPSSVVAYFMFFWERVFYWCWNSPIGWALLASRRQQPGCLFPPCAGMTSVHHPPSCFITSTTIIIIDTWILGPEVRSSCCLECTLWTADLSGLESWSTFIVCTQTMALFSSFANMYILYPRKGWRKHCTCWLAVPIEFELKINSPFFFSGERMD